MNSLIKAFENVDALQTTGVNLEGVHYVIPRAEDNLIFGKKGPQGFVAAKTASGEFYLFQLRNVFISAVLISMFEGDTGVGSATLISCEKLANYLSSSGY